MSECPEAPALERLEQCLNSSRDFHKYLAEKARLPASNILDLFDSDDPPSQQIQRVRQWLARLVQAPETDAPTDLIFYYTGHGGFVPADQSYFLATRKTCEGDEGPSSIRYVDLASAIKRSAPGLRRYFILDCCFAASSISIRAAQVSCSSSRSRSSCLGASTAILCSSAAKFVSIAPKGKRYTMFSGALLDCLNNGISHLNSDLLTLEAVGKHVRQRILIDYPEAAVRPELHVPEQSQGDPAQVPLFPNLARVAPFKFPVAEEPEDAPASRSPIIIAVEDAENPLQDGELLKTERHLTVSLGFASSMLCARSEKACPARTGRSLPFASTGGGSGRFSGRRSQPSPSCCS